MNPSPRPIDPTSDEQASLWAARLDGSVLSAADRSALDAWLAAHADHRNLLSAYCQFSADLEQQMPLLAGIRESSAEIEPAAKAAQPHPWMRRSIWAGAVLTAAAAVALIFWVARPRSQFETIATAVAQRQELTLADGTRVDLNAQTSLSVAIDRAGRRVRLASGEAFFAVSKDAARPFLVETPAGSVRVTGTRFNVRSRPPDSLEVTVEEGSVQARPATVGAAPVALTAGDRLTADAAGVARSHLSATALANATAWRRGQAVFVETPLHEALALFARYHGQGITPAPAVANLPITGGYPLDDLDGFLAALVEIFPAQVQVTHDLSGTTRVEARPARP